MERNLVLDDVPKQLEAKFDHHGMEVRFKARTPREFLAALLAVLIGIAVPAAPVVYLVSSVQNGADANSAVGISMIGIWLVLLFQVFAGPALFKRVARPTEVVITLDPKDLAWTRGIEKHRFALETLEAVEVHRSEIRIVGREGTERIPCMGLGRNATTWLDARIQEAWLRRTADLVESPTERAERQKLGKLTDHQGES